MVCGRPGPSRRRSLPSPDDHDNSCVGSCLSPKGPTAQGRCPREVLRRAITPTDVTGTVRAQRADITVHHVPTEAATSSAAWRSRAAIDLAMSRGRRQSRGPDSRLVTNALRRGKQRAFDSAPTAVIPRSPEVKSSKPESSHLGLNRLHPSARRPDGRSEHRVSAEHPSSGLRGGVFCTGGSRRTLSVVALPSSRSAGCVRSATCGWTSPARSPLAGRLVSCRMPLINPPQWTPPTWTQTQSTGARHRLANALRRVNAEGVRCTAKVRSPDPPMPDNRGRYVVHMNGLLTPLAQLASPPCFCGKGLCAARAAVHCVFPDLRGREGVDVAARLARAPVLHLATATGRPCPASALSRFAQGSDHAP